jgi:hypothetical protein
MKCGQLSSVKFKLICDNIFLQTKTALQAMTIFSTSPSPKNIKSAHETFSDSIKSILRTQTSMEDIQSSVTET